MGMDLKNRAGEELRFGNVGWTFLIHFAERYGWQPVEYDDPGLSATL